MTVPNPVSLFLLWYWDLISHIQKSATLLVHLHAYFPDGESSMESSKRTTQELNLDPPSEYNTGLLNKSGSPSNTETSGTGSYTHKHTDFPITQAATKALAGSRTGLGTVHLNEWQLQAPSHCWVAERDIEADQKTERDLIEQSGLCGWHMLCVSVRLWPADWLLSALSLPEVMLNRGRKKKWKNKNKNKTTMGVLPFEWTNN